MELICTFFPAKQSLGVKHNLTNNNRNINICKSSEENSEFYIMVNSFWRKLRAYLKL